MSNTAAALARIASVTSTSSPALTRTNTNASVASPHSAAASNGAAGSGDAASGKGASVGWTVSIRHLLWEKWRWGVVLALAVIVSRLSSSS